MTTETKAKQPGADQSAVRLRLCVWGLRLIVGGTFAFSGLVKAIDPWGFIFKIEEYLAVWHLTEPRSVVLMVAMLLSGYEFVLGSLLLMGCYKRTAPWGLLLSMALMLPLSLWLWVADPIPDCGCFGDFLTISNAATFWKNVVLTAGLILLIRWSPRLREALFNPAIQWMVAALASLYILIVNLYGYNAQPMADFRSYPVGTQLAVASDDSEASDETDSYTFIYEKEGVQREFSIDSLPDDSWTFVDRIASASAVSEATGPENPLTVFDANGNDATPEAFAPEGDEIVIVIPEPRRADVAYTYTLNELAAHADSAGIAICAILGTDAKGVARWRDMSMAAYPCYSADETQLKELARGQIAIVLLSDGQITSKTTLNSMDAEIIENPATTPMLLDELQGNGSAWFRYITGLFGAIVLLIYLFQGLILTLRAKIRRAYRKKAAENS